MLRKYGNYAIINIKFYAFFESETHNIPPDVKYIIKEKFNQALIIYRQKS